MIIVRTDVHSAFEHEKVMLSVNIIMVDSPGAEKKIWSRSQGLITIRFFRGKNTKIFIYSLRAYNFLISL